MSEIKAAIGLMSGTSMDGIDIALIWTDGINRIERGPSGFFPYSAQFRKAVGKSLETAQQIVKRDERPENLGEIETMITELHIEAVAKFLSDNELEPANVDVLGFHGQTVLHRPEAGMTVQLGDGQLLASRTGIVTVFDMRAEDMRHGGQGAPLVPVYHRALAENLPDEFTKKTPVAFVNIGGISNITYIGDVLIAFDTGPGNALIDQWVQRQVGIPIDDGGIIAAEGQIDKALVAEYLADPFFEKRIPKSLDRNDFQIPADNAGSVETVARSLARVAAEAIFKSVEHLPTPPALWVICGGGRHNPHIMRDLSELALKAGSRVVSADHVGLDGDAMEAEAWGYLAVRALHGLPLTYPFTTGVEVAVSGGVVREP